MVFLSKKAHFFNYYFRIYQAGIKKPRIDRNSGRVVEGIFVCYEEGITQIIATLQSEFSSYPNRLRCCQYIYVCDQKSYGEVS